MKTKILSFFALILFLAAGCSGSNSTLPNGVVKSVNGGADWQFSNRLASSTTASLASLNISKLAFDPQSTQTVYAGSYNGGLYKSADSAAAWTEILSKILVYDFAVNPINPKEIYAAGYYNSHGNVLKTTDGGASWQQIYNEESSANAVRAIALNPFNPEQIVIGLASGNVVRSYDGGASWKLSNNFEAQVNRIAWQNGFIYVLLKEKGLYKTADSADSYAELTAPVGKNQLFSFYYNGSSPVYSQLYVDPMTPNFIYVTTSRGLFKTLDGGVTWTNVSLPVQSDAAYVRAITVARSSSNIVFASIGNTIYKSLDAGATWQTQAIATDGLIDYILIDPNLPQIVYAGIYGTQ